jgi:hypothetical protein
MAYYLVKARPREDRLQELRAWLDSGEIAKMEPFGTTLQHSLENARLDEDGYAVWEEEDYCRPPLAQERAAVLDRHFTSLSVSPVEEGGGWKQIKHLSRLWERDGGFANG